MGVTLEAAARAGRAFSPVEKEALHMIYHKIARLTCGIPELAGRHTEDICGYAKLLHDHTP